MLEIERNVLLRLSAWRRTVHFIIFCYIVIHRNCAELKWGSEKVAYSSLVVRSKTLWAEANWERIQVSRKYFLIKRIKIWPEEGDRPSHRSFPVFNYQPHCIEIQFTVLNRAQPWSEVQYIAVQGQQQCHLCPKSWSGADYHEKIFWSTNILTWYISLSRDTSW